MRAQLKPLSDQVVVITGASSGIGLATARKAAAAGARVILVARNEQALIEACNDIGLDGGRCTWVVADVGEPADIMRVVDHAVERYGGFDTWVNDAGVGVYGDITEIPIEDQERLFRTNYWGVVHGSLAAAHHLKARPLGGAIINVGSILSDVAAPLMGPYVASKHAVKGFTDSLRMDLIRQRAPISVTLIKPSSIGTPFMEHARNYMDADPSVPPPVYAPEVVADAILHCAQHNVRHMTVGMGGRDMVLAGAAAPGLADRVFARVLPPLQRRGKRTIWHDNLHEPGEDGRARTDRVWSRPFSLYTAAHKHPGMTFGLAAVAGLAAMAWMNSSRRDQAAARLQPVS